MKTIISSALFTCCIIALFQLQSVADNEDPLAGLLAPTPAGPEGWSTFGEITLNDAILSLTPVDCAEDDDGYCFDLVAHNPTDDAINFDLNLAFRAQVGNEMSRMGPMPVELTAIQAAIQLQGQQTTTSRIRFGSDQFDHITIDEYTPLSVGVWGGENPGHWGQTVLANFSTPNPFGFGIPL